MLALGFGLSLKAKIFGLSTEAQVLGLIGLAARGLGLHLATQALATALALYFVTLLTSLQCHKIVYYLSYCYSIAWNRLYKKLTYRLETRRQQCISLLLSIAVIQLRLIISEAYVR